MSFKSFIAGNKSQEPVEPRIAIDLKTLVDLAAPAATLRLHRLTIRSRQAGSYVSRSKGRGMEFDEVRLYQPGDDIRSIDWRVTARTGTAHTKLFREERERPVFISVDCRRSMQFATRGVFKSVQAAKLAGLLAWTAQRHGDRIGGQVFSDRTCLELKPQHGRQAVLRLFHALVAPVEGHALEFTFEIGLARLSQHVRPGSLIYMIGDFRGLTPAAEPYWRKLAQHNDIVLIQVYDPLESRLPPGGRFRFADERRDVVVDTRDARRLADYHRLFDERCRYLENLAKKLRMTFIQCSTAQDPVQSLR
ncbi:MAG: DUF58 domain-containing protein [Methylomicrobium sp.]